MNDNLEKRFNKLWDSRVEKCMNERSYRGYQEIKSFIEKELQVKIKQEPIFFPYPLEFQIIIPRKKWGCNWIVKLNIKNDFKRIWITSDPKAWGHRRKDDEYFLKSTHTCLTSIHLHFKRKCQKE